MYCYQPFSITGIMNATTYDIGIESTEKEKKRLVSLWVNVSDYAGNFIELWIEKARIACIPDYLLDTRKKETTTSYYPSVMKTQEIPIDVELTVGERARVALRCGVTTSNLDGVYVYEIVRE